MRVGLACRMPILKHDLPCWLAGFVIASWNLCCRCDRVAPSSNIGDNLEFGSIRRRASALRGQTSRYFSRSRARKLFPAMGPEQRRDMEKGLSGGAQHVLEGPEGYSALPESAAVSSADPPRASCPLLPAHPSAPGGAHPPGSIVYCVKRPVLLWLHMPRPGPTSAVPLLQHGIARASARSSQQGGHDGNQSQAQRIAAEVQEEEDELCDHV